MNKLAPLSRLDRTIIPASAYDTGADVSDPPFLLPSETPMPKPADYERYNSCERKLAFSSMPEAYAQIDQLVRTRGQRSVRPAMKLKPYHCKFCGNYHFGHRK